VPEGVADLEGGRLWFERAGEGFPVVLLHPGLWDARIWDAQFDDFAVHHDVVRYDARGYGRSDPPDRPYSDLRDLRNLLSHLGIARCALVGIASGAQLALDFALAHPEIAEAIVAVAPSLSGYRWADPGIDELVDRVDREVREGALERAMDIELAVWAPLAGGAGPTAARVRRIAMDNLQVLQLDDALIEPPASATSHLADVRAATLVIVGDRDLGEIHAIADLLVSSIPGATKRVVAEADQLVNVCRADRFNRLVLDFLSFRI
jgi:pimeloyl-ACP methyl ester carboxylesterase